MKYDDCLADMKASFGMVGMIPLAKAARYVGCHPEKLLSDPSFPVKRVGKQWRVTLTAFARWMTS